MTYQITLADRKVNATYNEDCDETFIHNPSGKLWNEGSHWNAWVDKLSKMPNFHHADPDCVTFFGKL